MRKQGLELCVQKFWPPGIPERWTRQENLCPADWGGWDALQSPDVRLSTSRAVKINFHCSKHPVVAICCSSLGELARGTSLQAVKLAHFREETRLWASLSVRHTASRTWLLPPVGWQVGTCEQMRSLSTQGSQGCPRKGMPPCSTVSPQLRPSWFLPVSLVGPNVLLSPP